MYGISNSSFLLFLNFDIFIDNFDILFSYSNKQDNVMSWLLCRLPAGQQVGLNIILKKTTMADRGLFVKQSFITRIYTLCKGRYSDKQTTRLPFTTLM